MIGWLITSDTSCTKVFRCRGRPCRWDLLITAMAVYLRVTEWQDCILLYPVALWKESGLVLHQRFSLSNTVKQFRLLKFFIVPRLVNSYVFSLIHRTIYYHVSCLRLSRLILTGSRCQSNLSRCAPCYRCSFHSRSESSKCISRCLGPSNLL